MQDNMIIDHTLNERIKALKASKKAQSKQVKQIQISNSMLYEQANMIQS